MVRSRVLFQLLPSKSNAKLSEFGHLDASYLNDYTIQLLVRELPVAYEQLDRVASCSGTVRPPDDSSFPLFTVICVGSALAGAVFRHVLVGDIIHFKRPKDGQLRHTIVTELYLETEDGKCWDVCKAVAKRRARGATQEAAGDGAPPLWTQTTLSLIKYPQLPEKTIDIAIVGKRYVCGTYFFQVVDWDYRYLPASQWLRPNFPQFFVEFVEEEMQPACDERMLMEDDFVPAHVEVGGKKKFAALGGDGADELGGPVGRLSAFDLEQHGHDVPDQPPLALGDAVTVKIVEVVVGTLSGVLFKAACQKRSRTATRLHAMVREKLSESSLYPLEAYMEGCYQRMLDDPFSDNSMGRVALGRLTAHPETDQVLFFDVHRLGKPRPLLRNVYEEAVDVENVRHHKERVVSEAVRPFVHLHEDEAGTGPAHQAYHGGGSSAEASDARVGKRTREQAESCPPRKRPPPIGEGCFLGGQEGEQVQDRGSGDDGRPGPSDGDTDTYLLEFCEPHCNKRCYLAVPDWAHEATRYEKSRRALPQTQAQWEAEQLLLQGTTTTVPASSRKRTPFSFSVQHRPAKTGLRLEPLPEPHVYLATPRPALRVVNGAIPAVRTVTVGEFLRLHKERLLQLQAQKRAATGCGGGGRAPAAAPQLFRVTLDGCRVVDPWPVLAKDAVVLDTVSLDGTTRVDGHSSIVRTLSALRFGLTLVSEERAHHSVLNNPTSCFASAKTNAGAVCKHKLPVFFYEKFGEHCGEEMMGDSVMGLRRKVFASDWELRTYCLGFVQRWLDRLRFLDGEMLVLAEWMVVPLQEISCGFPVYSTVLGWESWGIPRRGALRKAVFGGAVVENSRNSGWRTRILVRNLSQSYGRIRWSGA